MYKYNSHNLDKPLTKLKVSWLQLSITPKTTTRCPDSVICGYHMYINRIEWMETNSMLKLRKTIRMTDTRWPKSGGDIVGHLPWEISKCPNYSPLVARASVHLHFPWGPSRAANFHKWIVVTTTSKFINGLQWQKCSSKLTWQRIIINKQDKQQN